MQEEYCIIKGMRQLSHLWQQQCQSQMRERVQQRQAQLREQLQVQPLRQPGQAQAQGQRQRSLQPCLGTRGWEQAASSWALHKQQSASPSARGFWHLSAARSASHTCNEGFKVSPKFKMSPILTCETTVTNTARAATARATQPMVAAPLLATQNHLHKQHAWSPCMSSQQMPSERAGANDEQGQL